MFKPVFLTIMFLVWFASPFAAAELLTFIPSIAIADDRADEGRHKDGDEQSGQTDADGKIATATQLATENGSAVLASLPPDPGPAGKLTLAGIDSDGDGVRDDVQRWIALTFPHSQKTRAALTQLAKAYQALLLNANDKQRVYDAGVQLSKSIDCLYYIDGVNAAAFAQQLEAVVMNTALRSRTYIQASHNLSGRGFIGLSNQIQGCQFNPNLMPN